MQKFSKDSKKKLSTCDEDLQDLFNTVIEGYDCIVLEGHRSEERQQELYEKGASKVKHSKHNSNPSKAIDISPFPIPENWGRIPYGLLQNKEDREHMKIAIKELCKFYHFNGYVKGIANMKCINIRQGHDWDGDNNFNDQTFDDIIHTELK